jgi:hypothetical protein
MNSLVAMYRKGAITADHLVIESLHRINPQDPAPVLRDLPEEILARMEDLARSYRRQEMITNYGVLPATDQVEAAARWIERTRHPVASHSTPDPVSG